MMMRNGNAINGLKQLVCVDDPVEDLHTFEL